MIFKILIAENDSGIQKVLHNNISKIQTIFNQRNIDIQFQVFYAEDGETASECYAKHGCEFIIMDIGLDKEKHGNAAILAILQINPKQIIHVHSAAPKADIENSIELLNVKKISTETVKYFQKKTCNMEEMGVAIIQTINAMKLVVHLDESILITRKPKNRYQQPMALPGSLNTDKEDKQEMTIDTSTLPPGSVAEAESSEFESPLTPDPMTPSPEKSLPSLPHSPATPPKAQLLSTTRIMNFKGLKASYHRVILADEYPPLWVKKDFSPPVSFTPGDTPSMPPLSFSSIRSAATPVTRISLFAETRTDFSPSMTFIAEHTPISQIDLPTLIQRKSFEQSDPPVGRKKLKPVREDKSDAGSQGSDIVAKDLQNGAGSDEVVRCDRPLNPTPKAGKNHDSIPPLDLAKIKQARAVAAGDVKASRTVSPSQPIVHKSEISVSLANSAQKPFAAFGAGKKDQRKQKQAKAVSASQWSWCSCS